MMKYHNKKVEYGGRLFDSKAEADFYRFLLEKVKPVEIICQPTVELQPSFKKDGKSSFSFNVPSLKNISVLLLYLAKKITLDLISFFIISVII